MLASPVTEMEVSDLPKPCAALTVSKNLLTRLKTGAGFQLSAAPPLSLSESVYATLASIVRQTGATKVLRIANIGTLSSA
jgi:hypothetical protein